MRFSQGGTKSENFSTPWRSGFPQQVGLAVLNTLDCEIKAGIYQNPKQIGEASAEVLIALMNHNEHGASTDYRTMTVMGNGRMHPHCRRKALPPARTISTAFEETGYSTGFKKLKVQSLLKEDR